MSADAPRVEIVVPEYKVLYVVGTGEEGAVNQTATIERMAKDGWEWSGFTAVLGVDAAYETAPAVTVGVYLYFRRMPKTVAGERVRRVRGEIPLTPPVQLPRRARRAAEREMARHRHQPPAKLN